MMLRTALALGCWLASAALAPYSVRAEDPGAPAGSAVSADAAQPAADIPGCPGKANGAPCCATCQDKPEQAAKASAEKPGGECPCQRARRLKQAAEAAAP